MAVDHKVTLTRAVERPFTCPRCGAHGQAAFNAIGEGRWARESPLADLFNTDSAEERSAQDAASAVLIDADRIVALIRCPACKQRAPKALLWPTVRVLVPLLVALALPVLVGRMFGWFALVLVVVAIGIAWKERRRLQRADHVTLSGVAHGAKENAKTRFAPKPRPIAPPRPPVVSVPIVAPVIEKPRGPDEGPAFLTDRS